MKRNKFLTSILSSSLVIPTLLVSAASIASCKKSNNAQIPDDVQISSTRSQLDIDKGCAPFSIYMPCQPADNKVLVTITKQIGQHDVRLVQEWDNLGTGVSSYVYDVNMRFFSFNVGLKDFIGETIDVNFDLLLEYHDLNGNYQNRILRSLTVFTDYSSRPKTEELHILDINDFHAAAPGFGDPNFANIAAKNPGIVRVANEMSKTLDKYPGSLVLSAGDNATGEAFSTAMHGESLFPILSSLGVRYSAVGNHEFDWGLDQITNGTYENWARTNKTNGHWYIAGNILQNPNSQDYDWTTNPNDPNFDKDFTKWNNERARWCDPYKLINMDGHLVCLFGVTTDSTLSDGNQDVVRHFSFIDYNASINYSAYLCEQELGSDWFNKIDCFLVLSHLECDQKQEEGVRQKITGPAADLAEEINFKKIDGIIAGHSHKDVCGTIHNTYGKEIWIGQGLNSGQEFVDTKLIFDNTKPAGQRLKNIEMTVNKVKAAGAEEYEKATTEDERKAALQKAIDELAEIENQSDMSTILSSVIEKYKEESNQVHKILDKRISYTKYGAAYPIYDNLSLNIGHDYYLPHDKDDESNVYYDEQCGAWANLANMLGFSHMFNKEIDDESNNDLVYPAISFINFDSIGGQITGPSSTESSAEVKLQNIYTIQGYENSTYEGFLSVFQLANIIDYLLAGNGKFNYSNNVEYVSNNTDDEYARNNVQFDTEVKEKYTEGEETKERPVKCLKQEMPDVDYKGGKRKMCYLCGPLQWYGFAFEYEDATPAEQAATGRLHKLAYRVLTSADGALYEKYDKVPLIWIYVPPKKWDIKLLNNLYEPNKNTLIDDSYEEGKWCSAAAWLKEGNLIPTLINSFSYNGGNAQATVFKQYFDYSFLVDPTLYETKSLVNITREMLLEFCEMADSGSSFEFDLNPNIYRYELAKPYQS